MPTTDTATRSGYNLIARGVLGALRDNAGLKGYLDALARISVRRKLPQTQVAAMTAVSPSLPEFLPHVGVGTDGYPREMEPIGSG